MATLLTLMNGMEDWVTDKFGYFLDILGDRIICCHYPVSLLPIGIKIVSYTMVEVKLSPCRLKYNNRLVIIDAAGTPLLRLRRDRRNPPRQIMRCPTRERPLPEYVQIARHLPIQLIYSLRISDGRKVRRVLL